MRPRTSVTVSGSYRACTRSSDAPNPVVTTQRSQKLCHDNGIGDLDIAFAHEALARAYAVAGDSSRAREFTEQALAVAEEIVEREDRELVLADLGTILGQPSFW